MKLVRKMQEIGIIENYFSKIGVAVIHVTEGELLLNDSIIIQGSTTDIKMVVNSMQIDRKDVEKVESGEKVGLKVPERVRPGDLVFKE
jgi:putative protease